MTASKFYRSMIILIALLSTTSMLGCSDDELHNLRGGADCEAGACGHGADGNDGSQPRDQDGGEPSQNGHGDGGSQLSDGGGSERDSGAGEPPPPTPPPNCGDGILDGDEECDDGNIEPSDSCTHLCRHAVCGDGVRREDIGFGDDGFEECDDGNLRAGDGCNAQCAPEGLPPLSCVEVTGRDRPTIFCHSYRSYGIARRTCHLNRWFEGELVTIIDDADNELLATAVRRNREARAWIGLNDSETEAEFGWLGRDSEYRNFRPGQIGNDPSLDCVILRIDNNRWTPTDCDGSNPFICEAR